MKRDAAHGELVRPARPRAARPGGRKAGPTTDLPALEALSAASDRYIRSGGEPRRSSRRPSLAFSAVAGLVVGATLVLAGQFEHRIGLTLHLTGEPDLETVTSCRAELLDYASRTKSTDNGPLGKPFGWSVEVLGGDGLRLGFTTSNRTAGVKRATTLAHGFLAARQARLAKERATPSEAESALSDHAAGLLVRREELQKQVEAAAATLPETDPRPEHRTLVERWQARLIGFSRTRSSLAEASAGLVRLRSDPAPTFGVVSNEQRQTAMQADVALKQDLRELTVHLTELKLHLLNVWQESAGALEQLGIAADNLLETVARHETTGWDDGHAGSTPLLADAQPFADAVGRFTETWTKEFTTLKRLEVDAMSSDVLDVHARARARLRDFLFTAAKRLAAMRTRIHTLSAGGADHARHHVLESDLTRGFRTVQAAHHRFEFAAAAIEPRDNFRLDSALQGGRGLRRRTQQRLAAIDAHLEAQALEQTRQRRSRALSRAEQGVNHLRGATDQGIGELIDLQEALNARAGMTEGFLQTVLRAEVAAARLEAVRRDLERVQERFGELRARRVSAAEDPALEIASCGVIGPPTNLSRQLRFGGIGGALTLLAVLFGQWWITRKP